MILKIAWRNVWRNKRRSLIVLSSVIIGVISALLLDGLTLGMLNQMLFNQINTSISHMQVHKKGFNDNKTVQNFLPDHKKTEEIIKNDPSVKYYSKRVEAFGLLSSAVNSSGVNINGIVPGEEQNVTNIKSSIIEGSYLNTGDGDIVIGKNLADKLEVVLGDKVVVMSNTPDGSIGSEVFRIAGIYKTFSSDFERTNIYIPISRAQKMLNIGDNIHEIAIITDDYKNVSHVKENISKQLGGEFEVLTYKDLLPLLIITLDMYKEMTWIINMIVGLALIFGIINVMLMAVFERIREFGVLISIGMKTSGLFMMIVAESFIIGLFGSVFGLISGLAIQEVLSKTGINLSMFAEGLSSFGVGATIYPVVSIDNLISLLVMIPFISIIAALYPAYKAVKLEPVSAMRYV